MAKRKGKPSGKRKRSKVATSKLSNKRLNKLAKQGKLKKSLPKGKYLQLLQQRTGQRKTLPNKNDYQQTDTGGDEAEDERDIPIEEADYEYFATDGRDYGFLTEIPSDDTEQKKGRKKKNNEDDDRLETEYEQSTKVQIPQLKKALLPIKSGEGIIQRSVEVEEDEESEDDQNADAQDNEEKREEPLPTLTAAEIFFQRQRKLDKMKRKIANLASSIIENPENEISKLKELRLMLDEQDADICVTTRKLVSLSLMEVFKDIIPAYRIRTATEKEKQQTAKKETLKLRDFEERLLSNYKHYLEFLESICKGTLTKTQNKKQRMKNNFNIPKDAIQGLRDVAIRCLCCLLETHPHFNFRTNIIAVIIPFMNSKNSQVSDKVCEHVRRLFRADKAGEVTLEIVRLIGRMIKAKNFNIEPKVLDTFLSLKIREIDMGDGREDRTVESKATRREKFRKMSKRDRKRSKQMKELEKELEDVAAHDNKKTKLKLHTEIMKLVFLTYFRILKQARNSVLLSSVLEGLAKFAHLISIDFFDDLFGVLNELVVADELSYRDSLHCVQSAFTILTGQGDVFNIDPLTFYRHLYKTLYHLHVGNTSEDVSIAVECLQIMITKRKRQVSHQRLLSFIKRLTSLCLQLDHRGVLSVLASVRSFIQTDSRSEILFDTESRGSGVYLAHLDDPEHANASNTALYELHCLRRHYHPVVKQYAHHILRGAPSTGVGQLPPDLSRRSALELFDEFSTCTMEFKPNLPETSPRKRQNKSSGELKQECLSQKLGEVQEKMQETELIEISQNHNFYSSLRRISKRKRNNSNEIFFKKKKFRTN